MMELASHSATPKPLSPPHLTKGICRRWCTNTLALATLFVLAVAIPSAQAQTLTVLHSFAGGSDGEYPSTPLLIADGSIYGTTTYGGTYGFGTVFQMNAKGEETLLYSFAEMDGEYPAGGLVRDNLGIYGTTYMGGTFGWGTVFQVWGTVIYSFPPGLSNGVFPLAGLVADSAGSLYGTTSGGGTFGSGTVFTVTSSDEEIVLHSFGATGDGIEPVASLQRDSSGNLYGTTWWGGTSGVGTAFKVDASGNETVLYSFTGGADGGQPRAGLVVDSAGNLYGTTYQGGAFGLGTVFRLDASGGETVLHSFGGGDDGANPYAGLLPDGKGNLYGTTNVGGTHNLGTVFKVNRKGKETVVHSFSGTSDGEDPHACLVMDANGNLYGTAVGGGA